MSSDLLKLTDKEKELIRSALQSLPLAALFSIKNDGTVDKALEAEMKTWPDIVKSITDKLDL